MLEIEDKALALDFDLACNLRLHIYDNERERDRFKALSYMLGGAPDGDPEDEGETITI